jgi:molybdopterin/thiamine biosynthesis adenylyltransferase
MLIFQVARIAKEGDSLAEGKYEVPVRSSDGGDCLSTIPFPDLASSDCFKARLSIHVSFMQGEPLTLDEPGRAVALILADIERGRRGDLAGETSFGDAVAARLALLRYDLANPDLKNGFWVVQRELRRVGLDICVDESAVVVGHAERVGKQGVENLGVNLVSRFDRLRDRDGSLIDRDALQKKTVLIIGLGSVGSVVACDLARCGVGKFIVADKERLEWGNVVRHAAGLSDVGRLKSRIVTDLIRDRNPKAEISEISLELDSASKETYDHAVASADAVVCATDGRASRLICNRLCIKHRKKVIFGGLSSGAYAGMVFQFRSPETMCYHCFVSAFPDAAADRESNESEYAGGPDGHLALDIGPITNLMAKLVLVELQKQIGVVVGGLDADLAAPWYLWINRREGEYAELAPLGSPLRGPQILQWRPVPMDKIDECPHCGTKTS